MNSSAPPHDGMDESGSAHLTERQAALFLALSETAEDIARTAEFSAQVHTGMSDVSPAARAHAARDVRLAAAERVAAEHLRRGEIPPESVRAIIRYGGAVRDGSAVSGRLSPETEPSSADATPDE